jgi:Flp pilus assembly protein TadD
LALACGRRTDLTPPADDAGRAQVLIDSGNQAFSAGNFGLAARRYAAAAVIKKDDPAAYYGLGMALSKLGRDEEARAAYARARQLARP